VTDDDRKALRDWTEAHVLAGSTVALRIRALLAEYDACVSALAVSNATAERLAALLREREEHLADLIRAETEGMRA
jgi:hypothetical protein